MTARHNMFSISFVALILLAVDPLVQFQRADAAICACPPLWTGFSDHCYRYFSSKNISWFDAELACRSFSTPCGEDSSSGSVGHLVSIHSQDEMDFVVAMYDSLRSKRPSDVRVWIGLHDRTTENTTEWTDGTIFKYTSWAPSQPNDQGGASDCVFFSRNTLYQWNDIPCHPGSRVESFICKMRQW